MVPSTHTMHEMGMTQKPIESSLPIAALRKITELELQLRREQVRSEELNRNLSKCRSELESCGRNAENASLPSTADNGTNQELGSTNEQPGEKGEDRRQGAGQGKDLGSRTKAASELLRICEGTGRRPSRAPFQHVRSDTNSLDDPDYSRGEAEDAAAIRRLELRLQLVQLELASAKTSSAEEIRNLTLHLERSTSELEIAEVRIAALTARIRAAELQPMAAKGERHRLEQLSKALKEKEDRVQDLESKFRETEQRMAQERDKVEADRIRLKGEATDLERERSRLEAKKREFARSLADLEERQRAVEQLQIAVEEESKQAAAKVKSAIEEDKFVEAEFVSLEHKKIMIREFRSILDDREDALEHREDAVVKREKALIEEIAAVEQRQKEAQRREDALSEKQSLAEDRMHLLEQREAAIAKEQTALKRLGDSLEKKRETLEKKETAVQKLGKEINIVRDREKDLRLQVKTLEKKVLEAKATESNTQRREDGTEARRSSLYMVSCAEVYCPPLPPLITVAPPSLFKPHDNSESDPSKREEMQAMEATLKSTIKRLEKALRSRDEELDTAIAVQKVLRDQLKLHQKVDTLEFSPPIPGARSKKNTHDSANLNEEAASAAANKDKGRPPLRPAPSQGDVGMLEKLIQFTTQSKSKRPGQATRRKRPAGAGTSSGDMQGNDQDDGYGEDDSFSSPSPQAARLHQSRNKVAESKGLHPAVPSLSKASFRKKGRLLEVEVEDLADDATSISSASTVVAVSDCTAADSDGSQRPIHGRGRARHPPAMSSTQPAKRRAIASSPTADEQITRVETSNAKGSKGRSRAAAIRQSDDSMQSNNWDRSPEVGTEQLNQMDHNMAGATTKATVATTSYTTPPVGISAEQRKRPVGRQNSRGRIEIASANVAEEKSADNISESPPLSRASPEAPAASAKYNLRSARDSSDSSMRTSPPSQL